MTPVGWKGTSSTFISVLFSPRIPEPSHEEMPARYLTLNVLQQVSSLQTDMEKLLPTGRAEGSLATKAVGDPEGEPWVPRDLTGADDVTVRIRQSR